MIVELKAHIDATCVVTLFSPTPLPAGDVDLVITYVTEEENQDEALWSAQFAATPPAVFQALIDAGLADYEAGLTDEFDPEKEDG